MPAHTVRNESDDVLVYWRHVWSFFLQHNIPVFATQASMPRVYDTDYLVLSPQTSIRMSVGSVSQMLDRLMELYVWLQVCYDTSTHTDTAVELFSFEWNYLGLVSERNAYIEYLTELFWRHQTVFEGSQYYSRFVSLPWLCSNVIPELEQTIEFQLPTDYFSAKSVQFVAMVAHNLTVAEYNPYLIHSDSASLQWTITLPNMYELQGSLQQNKGSLTINIHMIPLTDIVI